MNNPFFYLCAGALFATSTTGFTPENSSWNDKKTSARNKSLLSELRAVIEPEDSRIDENRLNHMSEFFELQSYCEQLKTVYQKEVFENGRERIISLFTPEGQAVTNFDQFFSQDSCTQTQLKGHFQIIVARAEGVPGQENYLMVARAGGNTREMMALLENTFGQVVCDLELSPIQRQLGLDAKTNTKSELNEPEVQLVFKDKKFIVIRLDDFMRQLRDQLVSDVFTLKVLGTLLSSWSKIPPNEVPPNEMLGDDFVETHEVDGWKNTFQRSLPPAFDYELRLSLAKALKNGYRGNAIKQSDFDREKLMILTYAHRLCDEFYGLTREEEAQEKNVLFGQPDLPKKVSIALRSMLIDLFNDHNNSQER